MEVAVEVPEVEEAADEVEAEAEGHSLSTISPSH